MKLYIKFCRLSFNSFHVIVKTSNIHFLTSLITQFLHDISKTVYYSKPRFLSIIPPRGIEVYAKFGHDW